MNGPVVAWAAFVATVASRADWPAIVAAERTLTFGAWHDSALRYATIYLSRGLTRHGRVLLWLDTGPELACALFGAWAAGGIPVLMDPRSGAAHLAHAVDTVRPDILVQPLPADGQRFEREVAIVTPLDIGDAARCANAPGLKSLVTDAASIVFTSGSTGSPKGVTQSHGNLVRGCRTVAAYLGLTDLDRILCTVPWSFDYGFGQLLTTAMHGVTQIIPATPNPLGICSAIERSAPTVLAGVPSVFTYLLRGITPIRETDLASIRTVTNTGGTIPAPVFTELLDLFDSARVFLNYGLTETYRSSFLDPHLARTHSTSIGRAIPSCALVVMREDGRVADIGETGEIVHRGDHVCLGYWNDPAATAKALRPDPLWPPGGPSAPKVMYTGDHGCFDDQGLLYFKGRRDQQLKSMGVRVSPGDVEDLLYRSGLVTEVAVVGRPHDMIGDEICAFVVPVNGMASVTRDIGLYSRGAMSPYMVPRRVFVLDTLPRTVTGKVDYPKLRRDAVAAGAAAHAST